MKFAEDHNSARYKITGYENDRILINGNPVFENGFIVSPMELIRDWEPSDYTHLRSIHLDQIYHLDAEVILLGSGRTQCFPDTAILRKLASGRVGYEIMDTQAACRTFNILMSEGRNVVAALFLE